MHLSSHTLSLDQHEVFLMGSNSSRTIPPWVLFTWKSFRNRLLLCGSPVGSRNNVFPCELLFIGLQFSPGACSSLGFSRVHNFLQGLSTCFEVESSMGYWGRYLLHCGSPWTAAGQCASPWFSPQLQGNSCTGARALPTPSSLTLLYTGWLFSHFITPLSCLLWLCQAFCPFLKPYHRGAATVPVWLSLGQFGVSFVTNSVLTWGIFWCLLTKTFWQSIFPHPQLPRFAT